MFSASESTIAIFVSSMSLGQIGYTIIRTDTVTLMAAAANYNFMQISNFTSILACLEMSICKWPVECIIG